MVDFVGFSGRGSQRSFPIMPSQLMQRIRQSHTVMWQQRRPALSTSHSTETGYAHANSCWKSLFWHVLRIRRNQSGRRQRRRRGGSRCRPMSGAPRLKASWPPGKNRLPSCAATSRYTASPSHHDLKRQYNARLPLITFTSTLLA